jgi:hypothetical protein
MITIQTKGCSVHLSFHRKTIILHEMEYSSFKENLFVLEGSKRTQIQPEDLSWIDFHLLFFKHKPVYNDPLQDKLDMEYLLKNFSWSSIETYSNEQI